jgi:hypothetical protein
MPLQPLYRPPMATQNLVLVGTLNKISVKKQTIAIKLIFKFVKQ